MLNNKRFYPDKQLAIKLAEKRILPKGYKSEDYNIINSSLPKQIAMLIYKEYLHILKFGVINEDYDL